MTAKGKKPKKAKSQPSMIAGLRDAGAGVHPPRFVKKFDLVPALLLRKKEKR